MPKSRIVDRMVFSAAGLTAGLDSALKVNQHGVREAKFPDTAGDLGHLGLRMRPRVARVGDQSADFPPFDSDLSRARARAGVAGVEVFGGLPPWEADAGRIAVADVGVGGAHHYLDRSAEPGLVGGAD